MRWRLCRQEASTQAWEATAVGAGVSAKLSARGAVLRAAPLPLARLQTGDVNGFVRGPTDGGWVAEMQCNALPGCLAGNAGWAPAHPETARAPRDRRLMTWCTFVRAGRRWRSPSAGGSWPSAWRLGVL